MFYAFTIIILSYMAYVASREGSDSALRKSFVLVALLAPTWMTYNVRSIRLDFRIVHAIAAIGLLVLMPPKRKIVFHPCLTDVAMIALVGSLCVSQYLAGALAPLTPFDIGLTWLSTYFVGRIFLQAPEDLKRLAPMAAKVFCLVCVLALIEAITKRNPLNTLLGKTFGILESGEGYRWGMKRAQGNVSHPIYNGFQLILFLPLAVYLCKWGWQRTRKDWFAVLSPIALAVATFVTVSRGAQLGFLIASMIVVFFMFRSLRVPLIISAVVLGTSLFLFKDAVVEGLGTMAGEDPHEVRMIEINGEEVEYTGTKHRVLLLQVYEEPLKEAGWFGWGGALTDVKIEPQLENRFRSIDSHYILFYLQYGKVTTAIFLIIAAVVIWNSLRLSWQASELRPVLAGLVGSFVAVAISMTSVWFAPDYAAIWLFNAGLACNLKDLWRPVAPPQAVVVRVSRRLVPVTHSCREEYC